MKKNAEVGSALVIIVVAVLLIGVSSFAIWRWLAAVQSNNQAQQNPAGLTAGDDNNSLDADLSAITKSLNQEVTDANSAGTTLTKDAVTRLAGDILQTNRKLTALASKIQARIDQARGSKNIGTLQTQLDSMNETITEANITANSIQTKAKALSSTNSGSDSATLASYRDQLKATHLQNVSATTDARTIVNVLKEEK